MPANPYLSIDAAVRDMVRVGVTTLIFQRGDATGDQGHVLPLLAMNRLNAAYNLTLRKGQKRAIYGVLVIDAMKTVGMKTVGMKTVGTKDVTTAPSGANMADVYVDHFRVPAGQVAYCDTKATRMKDALAHQVRGLNKLSLTGTTDRTVAALLESKVNRNAIKQQFRGEKLSVLPVAVPIGPVLEGVVTPAATAEALIDMQLVGFREEKGIELNKPVVILWSRKSGKWVNGAYPEQDSSATGTAQLASRCHVAGYTVVLAGDLLEEKTLAPLAGGDRKHPAFAKAVWLGQFWKHWTPIPNRRDLQLRFFYILSKQLKAQGHRMVHVGMRSGGLDMYAFAGQRVVYIIAPVTARQGLNDGRMPDAVQAIQAARAITRVEDGKVHKQGGSLYLDRVVASRIPKAYHITGPRGRPRPRGFPEDDLVLIMGKIQAALN